MSETMTDTESRPDQDQGPATTPTAFVYLIDKDSGDTGEFVGFGSLLNDFVVALHAEADLAPRTSLRCLIVGAHVGVVDGKAVNDGTPDGPATGIQLAGRWRDPVTRVLPGRAVTSDDVRRTYGRWLRQRAADDPSASPYPPPAGPPVPLVDDVSSSDLPDGRPQSAQGGSPGYCMIFPKLPGCRH